MKGARGWIVAGVIAVSIAAGAYALRPQNDSPEHSSNSDAANGTSAVLLFAQAMGHPATQVEGSFAPPAANSVLFVFTPTSQYTADEAAALYDWVRNRGGVLVYASEGGDPELDRAFGVARAGVSSGGPYDASPAIDEAKTVEGGSFIKPLDPSPADVTILRSAGDGGVAGYSRRIGLGRVVVIADPLVLCNAYLEKADNGALLADLLGSASATPVAVDEYHHGLTVSDLSQAWVRTPWGAALVWLIVVVFAGLWLRGRRFGPVVERPAEVARSDAEWSVAVGQLLRRSSARSVTLGLLAAATERSVAAQTGLSVQPRESFWNALWVRAPQTASRLAEVEASIRRPNPSERDVLDAARKLHEIAHPSPHPGAARRPAS